MIWIFAVEAIVMITLQRIVPETVDHLLVTLMDAAILTATVAPLVWWLIVRPLDALLELRTRHLRGVYESIEEERRRVALELHDGTGQLLTMVVSGLRSLREAPDRNDFDERCHELQRLAQEALNEVKEVTTGLRPTLLDGLGLPAAVNRLADDIRRHTGLDLVVESGPGLDERLPAPLEISCFRIVQEALNNVQKHANATRATVRLAVERGELCATIEDDGRGVARDRPAQDRLARDGIGLSSMNERAILVGGTLEIRSTSGRGTSVVARLPIGGIRA